MMKVDCAIIGGGIVGLSVAFHLTKCQPGLRLVVLEKESHLASHQTGRNSGVIHSGIYYTPGSLKARYATAGNHSLIAFCREHGIEHDICGKVIVATEPEEVPCLEILYQRGLQNGIAVTRLTPDEVREKEPHVSCVAGLAVPSTGIVDYREVCNCLAELIAADGGILCTGTEVSEIKTYNAGHVVETTGEEVETRFLVNCAGLQSDRLARRAGVTLDARITPFRGEYFELIPEKRHLVRSLIYPVPDPQFPFLGVHFTKMIDGSVHAGPNAVLALKREGYHKSDFDLTDTLETLRYPGFWRLARKHYKEGFAEMYRSWSKRAFVRSLQRLVPEVSVDDLVPAKAGVRAQALLPSGVLVNDFLIARARHALHVCNAPSPAATASLEIGKEVVRQIPELRSRIKSVAHA
jgi:(S)-2-hydroxyglutarate dehydrogenase